MASRGRRKDSSKRKLMKMAVIGDKQVGKTSLITRYVHDSFSPHYTYTQGGDMEKINVTIEDTDVRVTLLDAAGHKYVRSLIRTLYRDVQGILVVFDVTRESTFESLQDWLSQINMVNTTGPVIFLVGNKTDLISHRCIPYGQAHVKSQQLNVPYFETSAKTGYNVHETFLALLRASWLHIAPCIASESIKITDSQRNLSETDNSCCSVT